MGFVEAGGAQPCGSRTGSNISGKAASTICSHTCRRCVRRVVVRCANAYPPSSVA